MSTSDDRREQARGNGVGQAGQFGHQQHSAPAAFDAGADVPSLGATPTPRVWVGFTHYNERGTVTGYSDDERVDPAAVRQVLDSWPIASVEELNSDDPQEASELLAGAIAAGGKVAWKLSERTSASATPDSYELNQYLAARRADEERRGADAVEAERASAKVEHAFHQLARQADRYQAQTAATTAFIARQLHPDAKEVLVGTNDMTGEYSLVGVRNRDGSIDTDRVDGDNRLESCLREMPWENPLWIEYIDETGDDAALQSEHGAAYILNINEVSLSSQAHLNELDNA